MTLDGTMKTVLPSESAMLPPPFTELDQQRELATLSPAEIARAEADVRGITATLAGLGLEEAEERDAGLRQLDEELSKIPDEQRAAYLEAIQRCPEMVNDEHKIAFLEREGFDAKLAAMRLVTYWEIKLDLFGREKCFHPLTLHGAMRGADDGMRNYCPSMVLPVRDTCGRAIILVDPSRRNLSKFSARRTAMATWYLVEAATEDPEVRKRGVVFLLNLKNMQRKHLKDGVKDHSDPSGSKFRLPVLFGVLPVPVRSIHVCHPNPIAYYLYPVFKYLIGKEMRLRIKLHYGSSEKVLQELETYCLPRDRVPSELDGDLKMDLVKWFNDRLELESKRLILQGQHNKIDGEAFSEEARAVKRSRKESNSPLSVDTAPSSIAEAITEKRPGRKADPRMNNAVIAKLANPDLSAHEALIKGGFDFPRPGDCNGISSSKSIYDSENVSLRQRKNQLNRRIRQAKKKQPADVGSTDVKGESDSAVSSDMDIQPLENGSSHVEKDNRHEVSDMDVDESSGPENENCPERRDSFYETIMELPGLDDLDAA